VTGRSTMACCAPANAPAPAYEKAPLVAHG
jgi:hypothetical protein